MDRVLFSNGGGIRNKPVTGKLLSLLNSVGDEANVYFEVTSGGQSDIHSGDTKGKPGGWTGSHRHDDGNAADLKAFTLSSDGSRHYLDQSNPADRATWQQITKLSRGAGATGIGAGPDYMGNFTMHIGFGKPSVWGAGGKSENAPQWLADAYHEGEHLPPGTIPTRVATATPMPASMTAAMAAARMGGSNPAADKAAHSALLAWAGSEPVAVPRARPANIDNGGFNMAPADLPLNAALPSNRGASYGPLTGQWGPKVGQLGMQPVARANVAAPTRAEALTEQYVARKSPDPTPTMPGSFAARAWASLPGAGPSQASVPSIKNTPTPLPTPTGGSFSTHLSAGAGSSNIEDTRGMSPEDKLIDAGQAYASGYASPSNTPTGSAFNGGWGSTAPIINPSIRSVPPKSDLQLIGSPEWNEFEKRTQDASAAPWWSVVGRPDAAPVSQAPTPFPAPAWYQPPYFAPAPLPSFRAPVVQPNRAPVSITVHGGQVAPVPQPRPAFLSLFAPAPRAQILSAAPQQQQQSALSPDVHAALMAQQSDDQRGINALRAAGMVDSFGMIR